MLNQIVLILSEFKVAGATLVDVAAPEVAGSSTTFSDSSVKYK